MCVLALICNYVAVRNFCAVGCAIFICFSFLFANYSTCFLVFFLGLFSCYVLLFYILCILCFFIILISFCVLFLYFCCLFPNFVQVYWPLPPRGKSIAVNKYHIISYHIISYHIIYIYIYSNNLVLFFSASEVSQCLLRSEDGLGSTTNKNL